MEDVVATPVIDVLGDSWEMYFGALEAYIKAHGGECPPDAYKHDIHDMGGGQKPLNLGMWQ